MYPSSSFSVGHQTISYREIHDGFSRTEHGRILASNVRYSGFKPDHISNQQWVRLLGKDVCNLEHLWLTYGVTRLYLTDLLQSGYELPVSDQQDLLLTAVSHDWAEAIVGDIQWDVKTKAEEDAELAALKCESLLWLETWMPEVRQHIRLAIERVLEGNDLQLAYHFNVIERLGSLRTGLNAFARSASVFDSELQTRLRLIPSYVLAHHIPFLLEQNGRCPSVDRFLRGNTKFITAAMTELPINPSVIADTYGIQRQPQLDEQFQIAKTVWLTTAL